MAPTLHAAPARSRPVAMRAPILPAPPAPPQSGMGRGYGGGDNGGLLLTDISSEERHALLALWCFQYEIVADRHDDEDDHALLAKARFMARWIGDMAPSGWFGRLKGRNLGVYLGDAMGQPEAIVAVRYELDTSSWKHTLFGRHVLIVDEVLLSPAVPDRLRPPMHAGILQALVALGAFHSMSVLMWEDFDI